MRNARVLGLMVVVAGAAACLEHRAWGAPSGVFRCDVGGRTLYQAEPCEDPATESGLTGGSFTVVDPQRGRPRPAAAATPDSARRVGRAAEDAEAAALAKAEACDRHQRAIDRIDARARVRSTTRLAEQRRKHKDEMWALSCAFP